MNYKNVIIADIDGTLADGTHRVHHVRNKPKNWAAYNAGMADDKVYEHTKAVYLALTNTRLYDIFIVSGREDRFRDVTEKWLLENGIIGYKALYMRPSNDFRRDDIIKQEILEKYFDQNSILCVFDDRKRVCDMWRANGIPLFNLGDGTDF